MKILFAPFILISLASNLACTPSEPEKPNVLPASNDMVCERAPTAYLVGEKPASPGDECGAAAKIQAIAYECGEQTNTMTFTQQALQGNIEKAQAKCNEFCKNQGGGSCAGVLTQQYECGLKSPPQKSLPVGQNVIHCPSRCRGQAFNYCSLYQGDFFATSDRSLFKDMHENCFCRKK
jgi:hypothetical protein